MAPLLTLQVDAASASAAQQRVARLVHALGPDVPYSTSLGSVHTCVMGVDSFVSERPEKHSLLRVSVGTEPSARLRAVFARAIEASELATSEGAHEG
jgi:hypothetical protein